MVAAMTDEDFAIAMNIDDEPWGGMKIVANMPAEKRAAYERLVNVGDELNLWTAGLDPKPRGVIVCHEHKRRRSL